MNDIESLKDELASAKAYQSECEKDWRKREKSLLRRIRSLENRAVAVKTISESDVLWNDALCHQENAPEYDEIVDALKVLRCG